MEKRIFVLALVITLVLTEVVEAWWRLTISSKTDPIFTSTTNTIQTVKETEPGADPGWRRISYCVCDGSSYAWAYAYDLTDPYDKRSKTEIDVDSWLRMRYDWINPSNQYQGSESGNPTTLTANVNLQITLKASASAYANPDTFAGRLLGHYAYVYGHSYASGTLEKSGGTPKGSDKGEAKASASITVNGVSISWATTVTPIPSGSSITASVQSGTAEIYKNLDTTDVVALGGGLQFNQSGAQVYVSTKATAKADQVFGFYGWGYGRSIVDSLEFLVP